jgi:predicted PurR-regulated permease PerM
VDVTQEKRPSKPCPGRLPVEFDPFSVAVGLGVVVGALGTVAVYLEPLALALAALAAAGWTARWARRRGDSAAAVGLGTVLGLVAPLGAFAAFFLAPPPIDAVRGLIVGVAWLPLWWRERQSDPLRAGEGGPGA